MRNPPGKMSAEIFHLVESGEREALAERLEAGETDLCARDESGRTALDLAALLGREEVVRLLTEKGAEVNLTNKSGECPPCRLCSSAPREQSTLLPL